MPASIGVNLRVTGHCRQGGRKYMEDFFTVAYQQTEDEKDLEYAFFGIYDGHGGAEAAAFAKEHLMETIIKHKSFWSENDEDVLRAIKDGYIATHYAMWKEQAKWPKTTSGLPSTAGTTASIAFIRRGKIYVGHVGDSGIILGYQEPGCSEWRAKPLTKDHKPECPVEIKRIQSCGGKVVSKSGKGVPRVVWNRPKIGHQGPVRRSTPIDEIPFLAVARSLGDLWSYNSRLNQFVVSPDPDCAVFSIDTKTHRCLIFGTDGLFNMISSSMAVHIVQQAERHNESAALSDSALKTWLNPSKCLVEKALERWQATKMRADNTSVVTLMLDPPGPPRAQVLQSRKKSLPESGLKIMTRYNLETPQTTSSSSTWSQRVQTTDQQAQNVQPNPITELPDDITPAAGREIYDNVARNIEIVENTSEKSDSPGKKDEKSGCSQTDQVPEPSVSSSNVLSKYLSNFALKERNFVPKARESTAFDPREPEKAETVNSSLVSEKVDDNSIQINEISSSNIEETHPEEMESVEEIHNEIRASLRSCTKQAVKNQQDVKENDRRAPKRKMEPEEPSHIARKSVRLTNSQEKSDLTQNKDSQSRKPAPCTLAEEKLKKLAEEAEKTKKLQELQEHNNNHINTRQVNVSVVKNAKKVGFKKKQSLRKHIAKKKIQHVIDTVMAKTRRQQAEKKQLDKPTDKTEKEKSPEKNVEKQEKSTKADKPNRKSEKKVIATKKISNFKRQSERNASLRKREVKTTQVKKDVVQNIVKTVKKMDATSEVKENLKGRPKGAKNNIKYVGGRSSTRLSNNAKEIGDSGPKTPLNKISENKQSPKNQSTGKAVDTKKHISTKHSLRQRIQKKTESLRRNIQRRS